MYWIFSCLLYTSDAADDLLCVDLGGRRIIKKLSSEIKDNNFTCIRFFEIEDKPFENEIMQIISDLDIKCEVLNTPMFLDSRESFKNFVGDKKFLLQAHYYKKVRKEMDILLSLIHI